MTRDQMIEAMARAMCQSGHMNPDERMPNDGPRWGYYAEMATAALDRIAPALIEQGRREERAAVVAWHRRKNTFWHQEAVRLADDADASENCQAAIATSVTHAISADAIQRGDHAGDRP